MLGEVGGIMTHDEDGRHDEREAVMITELDEHEHLMKMISGGAWSESVGSELMGRLT